MATNQCDSFESLLLLLLTYFFFFIKFDLKNSQRLLKFKYNFNWIIISEIKKIL